MPITEYPFLKAGVHLLSRPMLYLRVTNPHSGLHIDIAGLIDTGADECALPAVYAELLGHNLQAGKPKNIGTGNGITTAYSHTCNVQIFDTVAFEQSKEEVVYTVADTPIDFMPNLHCVLLGVGNFLSQFVLTVDYPRQVFSIRKP